MSLCKTPSFINQPYDELYHEDPRFVAVFERVQIGTMGVECVRLNKCEADWPGNWVSL